MTTSHRFSLTTPPPLPLPALYFLFSHFAIIWCKLRWLYIKISSTPWRTLLRNIEYCFGSQQQQQRQEQQQQQQQQLEKLEEEKL